MLLMRTFDITLGPAGLHLPSSQETGTEAQSSVVLWLSSQSAKTEPQNTIVLRCTDVLFLSPQHLFLNHSTSFLKSISYLWLGSQM